MAKESKGTKGRGSRGVGWLATLRMWYYFSVPRTWLYSMLGFHFGYYIASGGDLGWRLWLGDILYGPVGTGATNLINMVYDRKEDSVNKPVRTVYIKYVTAKQMTIATWLLYAVSLAIAAVYQDAIFMAWTVVDIFHSHQYSAPPLRLKKHWLTNNTFLSLGSSTVPFIAGWMLVRPASELPVAALVLQFLFILFTLIAKDVPDIEGDRFAKLSTIPLDFGLLHYRVLAWAPMVLGLAFVLTGFLEQRYLLFVATITVVMALIQFSDAGKRLGPHDNRITHFVKVFTYSQMADCMLFTMTDPTEQNIKFGVITAAVSFVFIFTSGYLYPSKGCGVEEANPQHGG